MLAALRVARLGLHVLAGLAVALAWRRLPLLAQQNIVAWWARGLLACLGVRLRAFGPPHAQHGLVVANHVSWLDVAAIAAIYPAVFVCKSEIRGWPVIGWLLRQAGTVFIRRGSIRGVWRANLQLRARFMAERSVAVFPEGTTSDGDVLPFRAALFQPALERGLPIYPIALAYSGREADYVGDTTFVQSLLAIVSARGLEVRVAPLTPLATEGLTRRALAKRAQGLVTDEARRLRSLSPIHSTIPCYLFRTEGR